MSIPFSHTLDAGAAQAASIQVNVEKREVSGSVLDMGGMTGRFGGYTTYFVAKFNQPLANWGTWNGNAITWSGNSANATRTSDSIMNLGAYVGWSAASGVNSVEFTVGLSSISVDQARLNIDLEVGSKDFNAVLSETQAIWEAQLSRIQVVDPIYKEDVVKFYSVSIHDPAHKFFTNVDFQAAYHSLCSPTLFSEPQRSGVPQYLGFDRKTHDVAAGQKGYFTDMSIWDVHRTQFPWLVLYQPQVMQDVVSSLLQMYQQGGSLPRWPFLNGYTSAMIGTHGIVVIADAYLKGLKAFNTTLVRCHQCFQGLLACPNVAGP
jgi:putative alpha-1,2-mannosidase